MREEMGIFKAVSVCLTEKYFDFSGRATRKEYWSYWIVMVIANAVIFAVFEFLDNMAPYPSSFTFYLGKLCQLALFAPSLSAGVRRLHDTGRSGWWICLSFIPVVGIIVLLVLLCLASEEKENEYGPYVIN